MSLREDRQYLAEQRKAKEEAAKLARQKSINEFNQHIVEEENQKMAKKYNDMMTIAKYLQNNQHIASELYRLILKDRIKEKGVIKSDNDTIEEWLDSFDDGWKNNSY